MKCSISGKANYFQPVPLEPNMLNEHITYWLLCPVASGDHKCPAYHNTHLHSSCKSGPSLGEQPWPIHNSWWEGDRLRTGGGGPGPSCPHTAAHMAGPAACTHVTWSQDGLHLHLNRWQASHVASHSLWEGNQAATGIASGKEMARGIPMKPWKD